MFLKSLTLRGFKSFAETSNLEFEPGVTVVVGPNGSGKSNIVDAVAWVLGAQGPRSLRSGKMEDVIFAGTSKRPALGRAEVSLIIDNSAGLLPIDFSEVRITRALWRSGESEYSINGAPCRLLDVQDLLSDTGVGRQQHTIISQSQLDAILSARAEDRRAVIEEAAGVSKHRRRKEKAERRLEATESALVRAQDLLREVRRQLRPLQRQAEAARRHAGLVEELGALRRYLHGRELEALRSRLAASGSARAQLSVDEGNALALVARLDTDVSGWEAALDAKRREADVVDLGELVPSAEGLRARASGLVALLNERLRRAERDRDASVDQDVVATLEAEAASLGRQLEATETEAAELLPLEAEVALAERALAQETAQLEADFAGQGEEVAGPAEAAAAAAKRAGEVRARTEALRRAASHAAAEVARLDERAAALAARCSRLEAEESQSAGLLEGAQAARSALTDAAAECSARLSEAEAEAAAAEERCRQAEQRRHSTAARADALAQALDEARARAGARRLGEVAGFVGALLDLVEVDEGLELAFEAAAGEALSAVLMEDEVAARRALGHLAAIGSAGAVVPLLARSPGQGPAARPSSPAAELPQGSEWLRGHVRSSHPAVAFLLDGLLAGAVVVGGGWAAAVELSADRPELVVVTRSGDRCAGRIWRTGAMGGGAAVTASAVDEARAAADEAVSEARQAAGLEQDAKSSLERARATGAEQLRLIAANDANLRSAAEALQRARAGLEEARAEEVALAVQRESLAGARSADEARLRELESQLPELDAVAAELSAEEAARTGAERAARSNLAAKAGAVAALRRDLEVRATAVEQRRTLLGERLGEVEKKLEGNAAERARAEERRLEAEATVGAVSGLSAFVQSRAALLESLLGELRQRRRAESELLRRSTEELEALRRQRAAAERQLSGLREQLARADGEEAQLRARLEALTEAVRRELDCEPEAVLGAGCPELPPGTSAPSRARELERELRLMGPVNPLALEEYAALEQRHEFLEAQLRDVTSARRDLAKVLKAVDGEIITIFKAAFDDVAENFAKLVSTLFPGGQGGLSLTDPANLLESGVELEVRPVGKNIRRLSLLSGGERSLVALAFLFSVFRSRPSPFYMMDEVESALDDVNLHRFLDLVHEFRDEAQLLVVSHQKRTMEAADCLYGVSMPPGGASMVVSQKIERSPRAEASSLVAPR